MIKEVRKNRGVRRAAFFVVLPLSVLFLVGSVGWIVLETPWFTSKIIRSVVARYAGNVQLTDLQLKAQHVRFPGQMTFDDVRCQGLFNGQKFSVGISRISVSGLETLFLPQKALTMVMAKADVSFLPLRLSNMKASLAILRRDDGLFMMEGPLLVEKASWDKAELQDLSLQLVGDLSSMEMRDIRARLYSGEVQGQARMMWADKSYTVLAEIEGVNIAQAGEWNAALPQQLSGRLSGRVALTGRGEDLQEITTDWHMLDGSGISALLLSALTQYIPQSREKKRLDVLIKAGGKLPVQLLSFAVKTETPRHLLGEIHLKSKDVNLEVNMTNDIHTDGTLKSLLGYWQTYFK